MKRRFVLLLVVLASLVAACAPSVDMSGPAETGGVNYWRGDLAYDSGERQVVSFFFENSRRIGGLGYVWEDGEIIYSGSLFEGSSWSANQAEWVLATGTNRSEYYVFVGSFTGAQFDGQFMRVRFGREDYGKVTMALTDPRD